MEFGDALRRVIRGKDVYVCCDRDGRRGFALTPGSDILLVGGWRGADAVTTVRDATWELMRSFGISHVFGNPGSTEMRMFAGWPDDLEYVLALQEASVVAMADGYAQRVRNAALVNLHSAAGLGHALGSVLAAYRNRTPLVITAGQQTREMLPSEPFLYAEEATEFPKPYVKWSVEPARAADVPTALARAYHTAMTPPCGPVFVSIPEDDWDAEAAPVSTRRVSPVLGADPEAVRDFARRLAGARNPALVVGPGVDGDDASGEAVRLAESLNASVYVAPWSNRCSFPERHTLFRGFLSASKEAVAQGLAGHDVVLVVGAQVFTYHANTAGPFLPDGTEVLHMTDDPRQAFSAVVGEAVICSAKAGLEAILTEMDSMLPSENFPPEPRKSLDVLPVSDPLEAGTVLATLSDLMDDDDVIYEEATSYRRAIRTHLPIPTPGGFYNSFSGGLGWALPASVGGAMADRESRSICIIGDGSFMYSPQALWTAVQHRVPLTVIVLNNREYGALKGFLGRFGADDFPGGDLPGIDFVLEARGMGCTAERLEDPAKLEVALGAALNAEGPYLLDVPVAPIREDPL